MASGAEALTSARSRSAIATWLGGKSARSASGGMVSIEDLAGHGVHYALEREQPFDSVGMRGLDRVWLSADASRGAVRPR